MGQVSAGNSCKYVLCANQRRLLAFAFDPSTLARQCRKSRDSVSDPNDPSCRIGKKLKLANSRMRLRQLVGTGRFELPTPRTPSECSTRLSHVPTGWIPPMPRMQDAYSSLQRRGSISFYTRVGCTPELDPRTLCHRENACRPERSERPMEAAGEMHSSFNPQK